MLFLYCVTTRLPFSSHHPPGYSLLVVFFNRIWVVLESTASPLSALIGLEVRLFWTWIASPLSVLVAQWHQKPSCSKTSDYLETVFFIIVSFKCKACAIYSLYNLQLSWSKITLHFRSNYPVWLEKEFFHEIVSLLAVCFLSKTFHLPFLPSPSTPPTPQCGLSFVV